MPGYMLWDLSTSTKVCRDQTWKGSVVNGLRVGANGLVEEDGTAAVLAKTGGGQEHVTVSATVLLGVLDAEGFKATTAGGAGLVHGQNSLAGLGHVGHGLEELIGVLGGLDGEHCNRERWVPVQACAQGLWTAGRTGGVDLRGATRRDMTDVDPCIRVPGPRGHLPFYVRRKRELNVYKTSVIPMRTNTTPTRKRAGSATCRPSDRSVNS
eukprot:8730028-Pyramimonas_sp.AAC.2